jgi:hypothetical protein
MADEDDMIEYAEPVVEGQASALQEPIEVKARRRSTELEAKAFWKSVFADPVGRREIWGLLAQAHPFEERFACGPNGFPQTEATWFHAGEQALGLRIFQSLSIIDREGVFKMLDEYDPRFASAKPTKRKRNDRD